MADISYKDLIAPAFYGLWNDVVNQKYPEIWLAGGRGCIDGNTLIDTLEGRVRVKDFKGGLVYSYNPESHSIHVAHADKPKKYTWEDIYAVVNTLGQKILVTDEHKFLTPNGWVMTKDLKDPQGAPG